MHTSLILNWGFNVLVALDWDDDGLSSWGSYNRKSWKNLGKLRMRDFLGCKTLITFRLPANRSSFWYPNSINGKKTVKNNWRCNHYTQFAFQWFYECYNSVYSLYFSPLCPQIRLLYTIISNFFLVKTLTSVEESSLH